MTRESTGKSDGTHVPRSYGKTPYEIRLDLLSLSYTILLNRAGSEAHIITTDDIIAEATKLNKFISQG